ncbi:MoaD/ThiS family protein [Fodinibius salsisoli]|uniref:MoaD/ThiS family protein n=1 Tax=Fodinibius salsisoli TaxID=2820877 RepID=A0ABT3PTH3_9BACT|nr:MoaD/ThiS family protein [Fodinibius salsisoli]MCW9709160.1 MoaD/ThiS family protein [Fodinibius salsisoli]
MNLTLILFGITKEIIGEHRLSYQIPSSMDVKGLKQSLQEDYPELGRLASLAIAVNGCYAKDDHPIKKSDEIVLIPPVSGG